MSWQSFCILHAHCISVLFRLLTKQAVLFWQMDPEAGQARAQHDLTLMERAQKFVLQKHVSHISCRGKAGKALRKNHEETMGMDTVPYDMN